MVGNGVDADVSLGVLSSISASRSTQRFPLVMFVFSIFFFHEGMNYILYYAFILLEAHCLGCWNHQILQSKWFG